MEAFGERFSGGIGERKFKKDRPERGFTRRGEFDFFGDGGCLVRGCDRTLVLGKHISAPVARYPAPAQVLLLGTGIILHAEGDFHGFGGIIQYRVLSDADCDGCKRGAQEVVVHQGAPVEIDHVISREVVPWFGVMP